MHIWTSKSALQEWIEGSENIVDRAEDLFPTNSLPIFRFLYSSSIQANSYIDSGPIGEEELGQEDLGIETKYANYIEIIQRDRHLFESASNVPPVSPEIFDTEELRRIFREIFVFYAFVAFSDSVELVNNDWKLSLGFRSREIRDSIPMDGVGYWTSDFSESNLNSLYELYTEFVQEGLSETYNQLWKRSFVHQISNLSDIPTHANQISDYYQSLKEEAIETNFDELSDAIQDAHTFTVEVTNSISQTVRSLTNEIQKVVLTLLGAIFANVFLVLRWSNYEMVLPFTIFVISGVLLFYMPTINERIEQLDEIIKERSNDFDLYADTIEDYSGELFDFDNFRDRRDAYIQFAKRKRNWAVRSLELTFVLVVFVWIVLTIISLLYFPLRSVQYVAGVLSIPLLNIVNRKQAGTEYYPVDLDVINVSWPFRHSPPKMAEALMMLVLVSDVVIRLLEVKINI